MKPQFEVERGKVGPGGIVTSHDDQREAVEKIVRVGELLDDLGLTGRSNARPSQLSGGESARAGLAVALANEPAVLLADEPTGELDQGTQFRVLGLLRERAEHGTAVVVVTHNQTVAGAADREIRLSDGQVIS